MTCPICSSPPSAIEGLGGVVRGYCAECGTTWRAGPLTYTLPYPIGSTVYMPCGYKDCRSEPYRVLGYNIRNYGMEIVLYPAEPSPTGDIPIQRRIEDVFATAEEAERSGA
jgi:hypothetical protein